MNPKAIIWTLLSLGMAKTQKMEDVPKIQPFAFKPGVRIQDKTAVMCYAPSKWPVKYKWLKNGAELGDQNEIRIKVDEEISTSILSIDPIKSSSSANYTCIAENRVGKDSFTAQLSAEASPSWVVEPKDVTLLPGSSHSWVCEGSGMPIPRTKWWKSEGPNPEMDSPRRTLFGNSTSLVFSSIRAEDSGWYRCEVDNGVLPNLRKEVMLTVHVPARFEEKFVVVTAKKGDSARMKCEALGDQPLSVTWHKEQTVLSKNGENRYEIFETMVPKGMVSELIIRTTSREDGALYSCLAENEYGHDERKIRLLVMEVPARPMDLKIREVWSRSTSVSWSPPYSGNSPITQYIVQYWRDSGGTPHRLHELSAPSSQVSAILKDLQPGAAYVLKIVAENSVGRGDPSDAISFRTGEEEPGAPPSDIMADPRGSSTIRVSWKPPPKDGWNGELRGYYVGYKIRDSAQPYSYKTTEYIPDEGQEFFLSNLIKASDYNIVVKAFNSAGSGPPSHEMYVRTLDGDLPPSPSLYVLATSPTSVSLRWNTRKIDNILSGYTVHFREEHGHWQEVAVVAPDDNTYTLSNLLSERQYQIYVTATNQYGKGDPSEIVAVRTDESGGQSLLSVSTFGIHGNYLDLAVIVPVVASLLTICVVLTVACVCVKKIRSRHNLERALAAEKHLAMVGTLQRYVDIEKTRPLMDPNNPGMFPAPYETIPMADDPDNPHGQDMRVYYAKDGPQAPRKPSKDENIYDLPQ